MVNVPCPSCGADVPFRSAALPVRVCDYCQSAVMRIDGGFKDMGKIAILPFDVSPLQIGTAGKVDTLSFDVVGRVRWGWTDGSWNEWLLLMADGTTRWLGEAMGQFMLLAECDVTSLPPNVVKKLRVGGNFGVGQEAQVNGTTYIVSDVKDATCIGSEGELPFTAPQGWSVFSVDFRSATGACASFQRDRNETSFYEGRYVDLFELNPANLRTIEGWDMPRTGTSG
jgi:Domain of unknown function (DUF4178)